MDQHPASREFCVVNRRVRQDLNARCPASRLKRVRQISRVHNRVVRIKKSACQALGSDPRPKSSDLLGLKLFRDNAQCHLFIRAKLQMLPLGVIISQIESSALLVIDCEVRNAFKLTHEAAVQAARLDGESRQVRGCVQFPARSEHACSGPTCFSRDTPLIENRNCEACLR